MNAVVWEEVSTIRVSGWIKSLELEQCLNPFAHANGTDLFEPRSLLR